MGLSKLQPQVSSAPSLLSSQEPATAPAPPPAAAPPETAGWGPKPGGAARAKARRALAANTPVPLAAAAATPVAKGPRVLQDYAQLARTGGPALRALGINNAVDLAAFGNKLLAGGVSKEALQKVLSQQGPGWVSSLLQAAGHHVPGPMGTLLSDPGFATALSKAQELPRLLSALETGDTAGAWKVVAENKDIADAAIAALQKDPTTLKALASVGLDGADLGEAWTALPQLTQAATAATSGDVPAAFQHLTQALEDSPQLLHKALAHVTSHLPSNVQDALSRLNLQATDLPQFGAALPDVLQAAQRLPSDPAGALSALGKAVEAAPDVATKAITAAASYLPAGAGELKTLLSDPALVNAALTDTQLHDGVNQLLHGNTLEGMRALATDKNVLSCLAQDLAKDPGVMAALGKVGITSAGDIASLGAGVADAMKIGKDLSAPGGLAKVDVASTIRDVATLVKDLPPAMQAKVAHAVTDTLHLPQGLADALVATGTALEDPAVVQSLGAGARALSQGDFHGFIDNLASTARTLDAKDPEAAIALLNSLKSLPGGFGKLFADPTLNAAMVHSGSSADLWTAAQDLTDGNPEGALRELAHSAQALLGTGEHLQLPNGTELSFSKEGLQDYGRLMGRFVDALPADLKQRILTEVGAATARTGASLIPVVGDIGVTAVDLGKLGVDVAKHGQRDGLDYALDAAQLGLDVAGYFQLSKAATVPLKQAVAVGQVLKGAVSVVQDIDQFRSAFTGM